MKVILLEDVKGLGKKGQVVNAKSGHARNFLLPRNLAVEATQGNLRSLKEQQAAQDLKKEQEMEEAKKLAKQLENSPIEIGAKAGEGGKLFGSVTSKDLADALNNQHKIKVDRRKIVLPEPIRELGIMNIEIKLYPGVTGNLKVNIKGE